MEHMACPAGRFLESIYLRSQSRYVEPLSDVDRLGRFSEFPIIAPFLYTSGDCYPNMSRLRILAVVNGLEGGDAQEFILEMLRLTSVYPGTLH